MIIRVGDVNVPFTITVSGNIVNATNVSVDIISPDNVETSFPVLVGDITDDGEATVILTDIFAVRGAYHAVSTVTYQNNAVVVSDNVVQLMCYDKFEVVT